MAWSALTLAAALCFGGVGVVNRLLRHRAYGQQFVVSLGGDAIIDISGLVLGQKCDVIVQL